MGRESPGDKKCQELAHGRIVLERKDGHVLDAAFDIRYRGSPYQQWYKRNHALADAHHLEIAKRQGCHGRVYTKRLIVLVHALTRMYMSKHKLKQFVAFRAVDTFREVEKRIKVQADSRNLCL